MAIVAYREGQTYFMVTRGDSMCGPYQMPSTTFSFIRFMSDVLGGRSWYTKGVNGQTTSEILIDYPNDVYPYKPSIVVVEGGTNDYGVTSDPEPDIPTATSIQNLKDMIDGCFANGVLQVVWFKIMLDTNWSPEEQANAEAINAAVSTYVQANYSSIEVIEYNGDSVIEARKTIDGLHLSAGGYQQVGTEMGTDVLNAA